MIVKLAIKPGWHIYANPTGVAELNPTTLELDPGSRKLVTMEKPAYPAGVRKVLASSARKRLLSTKRSRDPGRLPGVERRQARSGRAQVSTELQACNDSLCQAPATLEIPLALTVGSEKPAK